MRGIGLEFAVVAAASLLLDALLGDPVWMPHPVVLMGKCIERLEARLRALFPKTERGERRAGLVLVLCMTLGTLLLSGAVFCLAGRVHLALRWLVEVFWGWQCLAMRGLSEEGRNVREKLTAGTLPEARTAVSRIVGRDTAALDDKGVIRAAVESVAENFSDGVIAPMLYLVLGGAPLALCYKAINTMDSMVGYKNEKYLHFGRAAARLDDAANWVPSRFAALLIIDAAFFRGEDARGARRIWRRDRRKHESPNSAQTEAAMAGALGIQLGGPASYFGKLHEKPTLGDPLREPVPGDIDRADRLMRTAGVLGLLILAAARIAVFFIV